MATDTESYRFYPNTGANDSPTAADRHDPDLQHTSRCSICKSPHQAELERRYFAGAAMRKLARDFRFSERAVRRHVAWFYLDVEKHVRFLVRTGPQADLTSHVTVQGALRALDMLARVGLEGIARRMERR